MPRASDEHDAQPTRPISPEGEAPPRPWLLVMGDGTADAHALPLTGTAVLGRGSDCDVRLIDGSISRRHATLEMGATIRVVDLGSVNGVSVRGRRLEPRESAEIVAGEPIQVGALSCVVQHGSAYLPPRAPVGSGARAAPASRSMPSLERATRGRWRAPGVVANDPAMVRLLDLAERVADSTISVLLLGETGAGKEVVAEAIHRCSSRARRPLLKLHCAALSPALLESELFGHERGAFTGALQSKTGLLESADGGTVFLDEVGELPESLQVKLLRTLEDRTVQRVGGLSARPIDVRFVAATNRDLKREVARGAFRQDLYFRLDGITLVVPPLRERHADIEPLARLFAQRAAVDCGRPDAPDIEPDALRAIERHAWPGNVRELRNAIGRATLLAGDGAIGLEHLAGDLSAPDPMVTNSAEDRVASQRAPAAPVLPDPLGEAPLRAQLDALEQRRVLDVLARCSGNQTRAAELLGMPRRTLVAKLAAWGTPRPRKG